MKIYTKTGDAGETGLFGGPRVRKDHARIEAFGTVDELNSELGIVRTHAPAATFDPLLRRIQNELFDLGAQLATPGPADERITEAHVAALEGEIDRHEEELEPLKNFILPAGTPLAGRMKLAAQPGATIPANAIEYLNRLGDLLFVLARVANRRAGVIDDPWHPH
jgi:cob(I)alamin adenosyltransferase